MAAPAPTRTANAAPSAAPPAVQSHQSAASAPSAGVGSAAGTGGGLLSGIASTVIQGMAFGTGSAVAHRAVDAIAGPRQVEHVHTQADSTVAASSASSASRAQFCNNELTNFQSCMTQNNSNISACQFFFDMLSQCQNNQSQRV